MIFNSGKKRNRWIKTIILFLILLISALFVSCKEDDELIEDLPQDITSAESTEEPEILPQPEPIIPPFYNAVIEYGEPDSIIFNTGPLMTYIRFPSTNDFADDIIKNWADAIYKNLFDGFNEKLALDSSAEGEINMHFDSYIFNGRFAGILEKGMYMDSHMAHPQDIIRIFNLDIECGVLLDNSDILDVSQNTVQLLRKKIIETKAEVADYLDNIDESWLSDIVIGNNGVIVVLKRGDYLPGYLGTITVVLPYDELGLLLLLGAKPTTESTIEPETEPPTESVTEPTTEPVPVTEPPTEFVTEPQPPPAPKPNGEIDPLKPMIALTFDDGPSKYTAQILDCLERYGVRATFCVVGNLAENRKDTINRAFDMNCEIIGHSWDHRDLRKLSKEEITAEIIDTYELINSITGSAPKMYRPPYGAVNDLVKEVSAGLGFSLIQWSVDPMDWSSRDAGMVYSAIMNDTKNLDIVLSHDAYGSTADAMERVIPELLSQGYQLVTVSELMYYSEITLEAGKIYYYAK